MPRYAQLITAATIALALVLSPVPANAEDRGNSNEASFYTLVDGDRDPGQLVTHMGVTAPDAFREVLLWNPQLHNIYALGPGTRLRVPGSGPRPAFPAFETDYSKWKVIGTHTSRFVGSPWERVTNIIVSANAVNNFFDNSAHPYISPRDSLSLTYLLGEISLRTGYTLGKAIGMEDGKLIDIPAVGGGICQLPSTVFPAAAKAGLDIVKRTNHAYFPYFYWDYADGFGFDATVAPPYGPDLLIRNLYDYPVRLFARVDTTAQSLTVDVYAPPQLTPFHTEIDGPYLYTGTYIPVADAGWVWWAARAVVSQKVWVDGGQWDRPFWSSYMKDPHR
ncbi:MAG: VanW family protein [Chloroflexota bacterium]|nr:VanW family protein [Chloroflexota bacterium]